MLSPRENQAEFIDQHFDHYHETDMQFNVGRIEGQQPRGYDIVDESGADRYYVTSPSSSVAASRLAQRFGDQVVPPVVIETDDIAVYDITAGSRLLVKTLQQAPYGEKYMQKLCNRTGFFLRAVRRLDAGLFGLTIENLAVSYKEDEEVDDTFLTVVPPLREPGTVPPVTNNHLMLDASRFIAKPDSRAAFWKGLNGE